MNSPTAGETEFLLEEFRALRTEILAHEERLTRLLTFGITGIPVIIGAAMQFKVVLFVIASPIITVVFALILLYTQNSIMRAGAYISMIEERLLGSDSRLGWERFLELGRNRRAEQFSFISTQSVFLLYYLGSGWLAWRTMVDAVGTVPGQVYAALLAIVFLSSLYTVLRNFPRATAQFRR